MRYKFRYFNGIFKSAARIGGVLQNFFVTIAFFLAAYYLIGRLAILIGLDDYLINEKVFEVVQKVMFISSVISVLVYCVFRKGVFLYDDRLVIARYTFTPTNWRPRITINYDEIEHVNVNYHNIHFTKYRYSLVVPCGDETYNVELTLKSGKKYFFSIQDQEEFCQNLNALINK